MVDPSRRMADDPPSMSAMSRRRRGRVIVLVAMVCAPSALAQDQPIEQGVADVDPLRRSFRVINPDLRMDVGFEGLYRLDESDAASPFYRRAGGVYAVFPQSVYFETRQGLIVDIPPGTVFHFGKPEPAMVPGDALPPGESLSIDRLRLNGASGLRQQSRRSPSPLMQTRQDRAAPPTDERNKQDAGGEPEEAAPAAREPGVMSDEAYRARRLAQIAARHAAPRSPR